MQDFYRCRSYRAKSLIKSRSNLGRNLNQTNNVYRFCRLIYYEMNQKTVHECFQDKQPFFFSGKKYGPEFIGPLKKWLYV